MIKLKIKIADYIIVGAILLWGLAGFWFNLQEASAAEQKYAVIYVQNQRVAELSLSVGDQYNHNIQFGKNNEHTAVIEVNNGQIRMLPMDEALCPRAICSHTGWITYSYESIVCLPNQIMIVFTERTSGSSAGDIDGITY